MQYANDWEIKTMEHGDVFEARKMLPLLSANQIAAIKISNFYSQADLAFIDNNIDRRDIAWYANSENKQGRIGISATEYHSKENGKALYFSLVAKATTAREKMFHGVQDPIQKIVDMFSADYKISMALEPSMNEAPYFSGLIRAMGAKSTLHFDHAPVQLPGWKVSESEEQFSLVLYLQMPDVGGELNIYNHPWVPEDEVYNKDILEKGPNGFDPIFLESEEPTKVPPASGDLIIFRTRNFHQIDSIGSGQIRLSFNSFMTLNGDELSLWS